MTSLYFYLERCLYVSKQIGPTEAFQHRNTALLISNNEASYMYAGTTTVHYDFLQINYHTLQKKTGNPHFKTKSQNNLKQLFELSQNK